MKLKRALSLFMTAILLSSSMPLNTFAEDISVDESAIVAEDNTVSGSALSVISSEIDVDFNITGQWDGGFNGEITIKNLSDKLIENWQIKMQFPQEITNIWNANILSYEDDMYIIKNAGYNNNINIPAGESVSFGFSGTYDNEIIEPSNIELLLSPDTAKKNNYDIEYQVMSDWGSGYTAQIIITNNTDAAMEGWHLNFDYARKIDSIWNAAVEASEGESYTVSNAGYNSVIPAKASISFGFMGNGGNISDVPQNYELILNSTTEESLAPEIIVNEDSLGDYKTIADSYIISDEITSASGELKNKRSFKEFYYIISSRSGEEIERKNIDINSNWAIEDIDLKNKTLAIVGITKDDTVILKMVIYIDPEYDYKDNDDDGLVNIFEDCFNTDKENEDSDGDKLPDGYEVWYLNTSPVLEDTDGNEISDADEDSDDDGLNNLDEFNRSTLPLSADTDGDTLIDGDEVNKYGTDPILPDTDGDTLNDNDELKISFDPLIKDTDDNGIDDNDEIITQTFTQKIDNDEKKAVTSVSVTLACKGNIENSVSIEDMYNKDILSSGVVGLVGVPVEIQCDQTFDTAEIKFTYDESQLGATSEDDLAVMWYDEANNKYILLDESVIDKENNTASYVTTHFSTYLLVDRKVWLDAWRRDTPTTPIETYYDVAFVLDVSGSMDGTRINKAKAAICTFIKALSDKDRGAIISFNYNSYLEAGLTSDREVLLSAAENAALKTASHGGTNTNKGLYTGLMQLKNADNTSNHKQIVIMICDGDVNYVQSTIDIAKNNNIAVYTVNVVNSSNGLLEKIASETNGEYYYAATSNELGTVLGDIQNTIVSDDSDGDGLKDIWETEGMQIPNGDRLRTNPHNKHSDNDNMPDGEEMGPYDEVDDYFPEYRSNPLDEDTDEDGCDDLHDLHPKKPARNHDLFKVVDSIDYLPEITYKKDFREKSDEIYGKGKYDIDELTKIKKHSLILLGFLDGGYSTGGKSYIDPLFVKEATANYVHFLDNTGTDKEIDVKTLLATSEYAEIQQREVLRKLTQYVEDVLKEGDTITVGVVDDNETSFAAFSKNLITGTRDLNWFVAYGECSATVTGTYTKTDEDYYEGVCKYTVFDFYDWQENGPSVFVICSPIEINGKKEWNVIPSDGDLYKLHHAGWAKHYYSKGTLTQNHCWHK